MAVYVDDMYKNPIGEFGRMKMSHLIADTTEELLAMVDKIGVQRKWIQYSGTWEEHFDIAMGKRTLAIKFGATPISMRDTLKYQLRKKLNSEQNPENKEMTKEKEAEIKQKLAEYFNRTIFNEETKQHVVTFDAFNTDEKSIAEKVLELLKQ